MFMPRESQSPITEYVERVKEAVQGENAAQEIKDAVTKLLKSYAIKAPER